VSKTDSRGMYRSRHSSSPRAPDARTRGSGYVESPAKLEREFQKALKRNRQRLDEQRERIKRKAQNRPVIGRSEARKRSLELFRVNSW
jgi:hypothetical protein